MNSEELIQYAESTFAECLDIMKKKNADYSNSSKTNNAFQNLSLGELYKIGTTEQGMWYRLSDKFSRLSTFISSGNFLVKTESVHDCILDFVNYLILLKAYLHSKEKK